MIFKGIRKIHEGKFITRYDVDYLTAEGNEKTYEIISRSRDIQTLEALQNTTPDSVVLILTDESGEHILVSREYRMAMAQWIYNFPAGLIDPGESPEESAKRELWEETGLEVEVVAAVGPLRHVRGVQHHPAGLVRGVVHPAVYDTLILPVAQVVHRGGPADVISKAENGAARKVMRAVDVHAVAEDMRLPVRYVFPGGEVGVESLLLLVFVHKNLLRRV